MIERLRELIENFPFMKPPLATSNLMVGICTACASQDDDDPSVKYKTVPKSTHESWSHEFVWNHSNPALKETFWYKPKPQAKSSASDASEYKNLLAAWQSTARSSKYSPSGAEPSPVDKSLIYYEENLHGFVEYLRNHTLHGTQKSLVKQGTDPDGKLLPRKQLMGSLNEVIVGASAHLEKFIIKVLILLIKENAFIGMYVSYYLAS